MFWLGFVAEHSLEEQLRLNSLVSQEKPISFYEMGEGEWKPSLSTHDH